MSCLRPRRRRIRWKRLALLLLVLFFLLTTLFWVGASAYHKFSSVPVVHSGTESRKPAAAAGPYINILLMGVDDGDNEYPGAPKRSDTMIVANINKESGKINLLSIPRDTRVAIPGHKGYEKITHAFFYGGSPLAVETVERLLQIPIHHYVVIDWQAFIEMVDILGGVDLYVENNMDYEDPYANLAIHLKTGYQHLDGSKAGQYVRFRSDELGDIGRVQRQQRFLKAMMEKNMNLGMVLKLPSLLHTVNQYVVTDVTAFEVLKMANCLKAFKMSDLHVEMLPGKFATIDGISFWSHDQLQTQQIVDRMVTNESTTMSGIFSQTKSNN